MSLGGEENRDPTVDAALEVLKRPRIQTPLPALRGSGVAAAGPTPYEDYLRTWGNVAPRGYDCQRRGASAARRRRSRRLLRQQHQPRVGRHVYVRKGGVLRRQPDRRKDRPRGFMTTLATRRTA
jgi:hypothetical protein